MESLFYFYFKVILPSVKYGLVLWLACCNSNLRDSIERLHCKAARIIFNSPRDMPSKEVLAYDRWPTISFYYTKKKSLRSFLKHTMKACLNFCLIIFTQKGVIGTHYGVETVYQYQDSKLDL